jgi:hypothetical protein
VRLPGLLAVLGAGRPVGAGSGRLRRDKGEQGGGADEGAEQKLGPVQGCFPFVYVGLPALARKGRAGAEMIAQRCVRAVAGPLAAAFGDPVVKALKVFSLGAGEAVSGLLVAARVDPPASDLFLAFLMD